MSELSTMETMRVEQLPLCHFCRLVVPSVSLYVHLLVSRALWNNHDDDSDDDS